MTDQELTNWLLNVNHPTLIMGVLNVTPDSFSDGGQFASTDAAIAHAREMAAAGAHIIDIGGESTRPGSQRVSADEQIGRILPVMKAIAGKVPAVLSVDTTRAAVAAAALDAGACLINDISAGLDDPSMLPLAAQRRAPLILMHMKGQPATMQQSPHYEDVVADVRQFLAERLDAARRAGVDAGRILLDPGIGFGKTAAHNLQLLRYLHRFMDLGRPLVLGVSRKAFIGRITGETDPSGRVMGTAAAVAWSVANGAAVVRVHDVEAMVKIVKVIQCIQAGSAP